MTDRQIVTTTTGQLATALAAVLPFAYPGDDLPALNVVEFHAGGGILTATATNQYAIGHYRADAGGDLPRGVRITHQVATQVLRMLNETLSDADLVTITADLGSDGHPTTEIRFAGTGATCTEPYEAFPDLRPVFDRLPTADDANLTGPVGLSRTTLQAVLSAVGVLEDATDDAVTTRWYARSTHEPVRVEIGDRFLAAVMPAHTHDEPHVPYGVPADALVAATA